MQQFDQKIKTQNEFDVYIKNLSSFIVCYVLEWYLFQTSRKQQRLNSPPESQPQLKEDLCANTQVIIDSTVPQSNKPTASVGSTGKRKKNSTTGFC